VEGDEVLAEEAKRLDRPIARELVYQRGGLPITAHQPAGWRARTGARDQLVLLGTQHGGFP
jgi:hypothetical protein